MKSILPALTLLAVAVQPPAADAAGSPEKPNVLLVITDDQGFGDLGCHGNPVIKTPVADKFATRAVECTHFYVCPVCSPTRSSLLTGRYNYRTGIVDTSYGRSMMRTDEVTLAAMLAGQGYRTGLFGKWHLGDNYPLRPQDRGFQDVLMNRGGGLGQPSDYPGSSYYRPILEHNGTVETVDRYCTDAYTDAALKFIDASAGKPFFCYVPYNAPHAPLDAPAAELALYKGLDPSSAAFPKVGQPVAGRSMSAEQMAKLYAMETNIDTNFGRLLAKLDERKLADNTIVIFLTDNGPQQGRYNAGLRGLKGTVYEGGIRVPFFVRWPAGGVPGAAGSVGGGRKVDAACAHIDIVPTILAACGVAPPQDRTIDGTNLLPLWQGKAQETPERTLFFQWHRGDVPEKGRACAARGRQYKLTQATGQQLGRRPEPKWELFDLLADPFEQHDLAAAKPDVVAGLKAAYEHWFDDVTKRGFDPPRIQVGTPHESPTRLTRQDWRGPRNTDWNAATGLGHWFVNLPTARTFDVAVRLKDVKDGSTVRFRLAGVTAEEKVSAGATGHTFRGLKLPAGDATLEAWVERNGQTAGVWDVTLTRVD
jgi:arylsulfatase A-like enzyme